MYLLGHIGLALGLLAVVDRSREQKDGLRKIQFALATMTPDLIDKPIGSLFFGKGRWFGHSILFLAIFMYLISYRRRELFPFIFAGSLLHLIGDLPSIQLKVILWPLLGSIPPEKKISFLLTALKPITWITETIGFLVIISVGIVEKWRKSWWMIFLSLSILYVSTLVTAVVLFI